jgi:palmitoyltransferase
MNEKNINEKLINNIVDLLDEENIESFIEYYKNPENEAWNYKSKEGGSSILHILIDKDLIDLLYQIVTITKKITTPDNYLAFIDSSNDNGMTPLHLACYKGNMQLIKFLINNGADITRRSKTGLSCLHYSAITNKVTPIYYLTNKFKEKLSLYETDNNKNTFFHWACYTSSEKIIDFYLNDKKFEKDRQNKDGYTPLQYYLFSKNKRSIKKLIFFGADPYIKNSKNESSFDIINDIYKNDDDSRENLLKILNRQYYIKYQYWIIIIFHYCYVLLAIIFAFPFINVFWIISYCIWSLFVWGYTYYFSRKDPGFIKKKENDYLLKLIDKEDNIDLSNYCIECQIEKKVYTKHCFYCERCVSGFDHHCRWFEKCIGRKNTNIYDILIALLLINSIFNLILWILANKNENPVRWTDIVFEKEIENGFKIVLSILYLFFFFGICVIIIPILKFLYQQKKQNNDYLSITNQDNEEAINLLPEKE